MKNKFKVIVCPKQKLVKIIEGKSIIRKYKFKMDIPTKVVEKEKHGYDWGEWSVSDRDFTYTAKETEWDKSVINEIRNRALSFYLKSLNK